MAGECNQRVSMNDQLSCSICLELFKDPVTLHCHHSFCTRCFQTIKPIDNTDENIITCPICRCQIDISDPNVVKKDIVLSRIVEVYKEDSTRRLRSLRPADNGNGGTIETENGPRFLDLNTAEFCQPVINSFSKTKPKEPNDSVTRLRDDTVGVAATRSETDQLTHCTICNEEPFATAAVFCATCLKQYCRQCWEGKHDINYGDHSDHAIYVYISIFQDNLNGQTICNVCDLDNPKMAEYICLHCNINFCAECFNLSHPIVVIHHFIVQKPQNATFCMCNQIARSKCNLCNKVFCHMCLIKKSKHECLADIETTENKIQKEFLDVMRQKKELISELSRFFSRNDPKTDVELNVNIDDRVVYFDGDIRHKGTVKWIGNLWNKPEDDTIYAGVAFDDPIGCSDGIYKGRRLFKCNTNCGYIVKLLELIHEKNYKEDETEEDNYSFLEARDVNVDDGNITDPTAIGELVNLEPPLASSGVSLSTKPSKTSNGLASFNSEMTSELPYSGLTLESSSSRPNHQLADIGDSFVHVGRNGFELGDIPDPAKMDAKDAAASAKLGANKLCIGDRVVYPNDEGGFCKGTVKWVGVLPDDKDRCVTVGVEFDEPIGNGTGMYKTHRLFYAKQNHASLVPMIGLIRYDDVMKT